jgi:hypothetical protein
MRRRDFVVFLGGLAAILPDATRAQPKEKVYRIGYLSAPTRASVQRILDSFLLKLRELGWIEGTISALDTDGPMETLRGCRNLQPS